MTNQHDIQKILKILIRCYNRMDVVYRLPAILINEKLPKDLISVAEFERLERICLDLSGMPCTQDKIDLYGHGELLNFINYWNSDNISERLANISVQRSENGEQFLAEFEKLLRMTASLLEEVIDFEGIESSDAQVRELHQQLLQMSEANRNEIGRLIDESTKKMERMHVTLETETEKLQSSVYELTAQLATCESSYDSELKSNQEEISKVTKVLRSTIDDHDKGVLPVYRKLSQLNEKIEKRQQINDELNETLAKQAVHYNRVIAEQERILNEQLKLFRENRSAKIIQRAYREFRLEKQKIMRKMKRKGRKGKK